MAKTILNKCPNCGTWCEAESKGLIGRLFSGWGNSIVDATETGGKYLGGLGEFAGAAIGTYTGAINGVFEAVAGDKFQFECPRCGAKWSTDEESDDESNLYHFECEVSELLEQFSDIVNKGKDDVEAYIRRVQAKLSDSRNSNLTRLYLNNLMAAAYNEQGDSAKANSFIKAAMEINPEFLLSTVLRGYIMGIGRNSSDALVALKSLIRYKEFESDDQVLYTEAQFHDRFVEIQHKYSSDFLSIAPEQRRFLYLIDGNLDDKLKVLPEIVRILPLSHLPTDLELLGVPQDNMLYICHPYKSNLYIPSDEYQLELLRDELHEFCHIMECLGAKRITLSDTHANQQCEAGAHSTNINAGGSYKEYSGSAHVGQQVSQSLDTMFQKELAECREFLCNPGLPPYLPTDLVWYSHRQEWQRKVSSRLEGRLIKDTYNISTSHSETVTGTKKLAIEAEVKALGASLNAGYDSASDFSIKQTDSYSQQIEVEFYPINSYTKVASTSSVTEPEKQKVKKNWTVVALVAVIIVLIAALTVMLLK